MSQPYKTQVTSFSAQPGVWQRWISAFAFLSPVILITLAIPTLAMAQVQHKHGEASLILVREGSSLDIQFISPAINLLGFERMPGSAIEWAKFATALEDIEKTVWLLGDNLADCTHQSKLVELPSFSLTDYGHVGHDHGSQGNAEPSNVHGDFNVSYQLSCASPIPAQIQLNAFRHFPGIKRILLQSRIDGEIGLGALSESTASLSLE